VRAVVRIVSEAPVRFETRGDANPAADPFPVPITDVNGVVGWTIPGLGTAVTNLRGAPAVIILVALPLGILAVTEVDGHGRRRRSEARAAT
jgi:hypothetical protein